MRFHSSNFCLVCDTGHSSKEGGGEGGRERGREETWSEGGGENHVLCEGYVPRNLGICAISRLRSAFSESRNCVPISRLRNIAAQSRDCAATLRNLEIAQ